jgi:drug/metabolite transporter (DMT)-like permease
LQRTSAGLGSVIIDSQPLTVAALAALFFGERLRPLGVAGLGVGVLGLCLLEVPPEVLSGASISFSSYIQENWWVLRLSSASVSVSWELCLFRCSLVH